MFILKIIFGYICKFADRISKICFDYIGLGGKHYLNKKVDLEDLPINFPTPIKIGMSLKRVEDSIGYWRVY